MTEAQVKQRMSEALDELAQLNAPTVTERRDFTYDEQRKWDTGMSEFKKLETERELCRSQFEPIRPDPAHPFQMKEGRSNNITMEHDNRIHIHNGLRKTDYNFHPDRIDSTRDIFNKFLRYGEGALSGKEHRQLQSDSATSGGFLMPVELQREVIADIREQVFMMNLCRVVELPVGESLKVPKQLDAADPTWTGECLPPSMATCFANGVNC